MALSLLPDQAQAEVPLGNPVVRIPLGKSGHGLKAPGVKVGTYGKGKLYSGDAGLVISDINVSSASRASMVFRDGLKLKRGKRSVTIKGMLLVVAKQKVTITGRIGSRRLQLFTGKASTAEIDGGRDALTLVVKKLVLTKPAAKAIAKSLRRFKPRSRMLGRLGGGAYAVAPPLSGDSLIDPGVASSCRPATGASADPAKPVGAIDITCGALTWHMRDSWISYMSTGAPIEPAAGLPSYPGSQHVCPTTGTTANAVYSFSLPVQSGWWDAATSTGAIQAAGGAHFVNADRGIDIRMTEIELRLAGAGSQMWANVVDVTHPSVQRTQFATMNGAAPMAGGALGPGTKLTRLQTLITAEMASSVFAGFYAAGESFGCVDAGFNF